MNIIDLTQGLDDIINETTEIYPYKEKGKPETYSPYNEGWSDAAELLGERIKEFIKESEPNINPSVEEKKRFWQAVFVAYVRSSDSINKNHAVEWADFAVKSLEERY